MGVSGAGLLVMSASCTRDAPVSQLSMIWKSYCCHRGHAVLYISKADTAQHQ